MTIRKNVLMYRFFGKAPGHACRECSNLITGQHHGKTLCNCKVYGLGYSVAFGWAQRYEACGMFNKEWNKAPIIGEEKPDRGEGQEDQNIPLDGQIKIWEV